MTDIQWSELSYSEQLSLKLTDLKEKLSPYTDIEADVFESPGTGYRMRAEFRIWHQGEDTHYAMHDSLTKQRYFIEAFPPAHRHIQNLMMPVLSIVKKQEVLRRRLFSIEYLSTLTGEALVTLIYHKPLGDEWQEEARRLRDQFDINIIGRSKKQKVVLGQDYVTERLKVAGRQYQYRQYENAFTQPNALINREMLGWATRQTENSSGDLLELYCGNGNFTMPLSRNFQEVLTTEISKSSIAALEWNIDANNIKNIAHARLSAEEIVEALDGVRPFRRLSHIDISTYDFNTIFVDPPRAGIDEKTLAFLSRFQKIIYVSCNPETLASNIAILSDTHQIEALAAFDQFPHTPHLETGVVLNKLN